LGSTFFGLGQVFRVASEGYTQLLDGANLPLVGQVKLRDLRRELIRDLLVSIFKTLSSSLTMLGTKLTFKLVYEKPIQV
jgi:hypothetical protein